MLNKYGIKRGKNILNIDESRARVSCPAGENIVVPFNVKEIYTASLENRKSIIIIKTIIANGREPLLLFVIAPG